MIIILLSVMTPPPRRADASNPRVLLDPLGLVGRLLGLFDLVLLVHLEIVAHRFDEIILGDLDVRSLERSRDGRRGQLLILIAARSPILDERHEVAQDLLADE